jgi:hypothetical protein
MLLESLTTASAEAPRMSTTPLLTAWLITGGGPASRFADDEIAYDLRSSIEECTRALARGQDFAS